MRPLRASLALGLALLLAGCASWSNRRPGDTAVKPTAGTVDKDAVPTEADLIRYLNQGASSLRSIDCDKLYIDCVAQGQHTPTLVGDLTCEKPRNFRLTGKVTGIQQVDFGSNAERFWFWVKQSPDQAIYHCAYSDYDKGVQLPFPFNPEWVMQALGMADYGTDDPNLSRFKLKVNKETYDLVETATLQGRPIKKITIIRRFNVAPPHSQVIAHVVKDANDKIICSATIKEVRVSKAQDAKGHPIIYPRTLVLEWPGEQLKLTLTMDRGVSINEAISPEMRNRLFTMPNWKEYKTIDLAHLPATPASRVQQAGAYTYR